VTRVRWLAVLGIAFALAVAAITVHDVQVQVGSVEPEVVLYENAVVGPAFLSIGGAAYDVRGLRVMDHIVEIDGRPVTGAAEIWEIARAGGPGTVMRATALRATGERIETSFGARVFTEADARELVLPFLLGGLSLLLVGSVPILVRPELASARVFFAFAVFFSTNFCFLVFDYFATYRFMPWSYVVSFLSKATLIHFALIFPEPRWPLRRWPRATLALLYGVLALLSVAWVVSMRVDPRWMYWLDGLAMPTFLAGFATLTANVAYTALCSPDVVQRQRARVVLAGPSLALVSWVLVVASAWGWKELRVPTAVSISIAWGLPVSIAYGMLKHNLFEFNAVARRGLSLGSVAVTIALAYLALFVAMQKLVGEGTAWASAALSALVIAAGIPALLPLRRRVESFVESQLFPDFRRASEAVHRASREIARVRGAGELASLLRRTLDASARPVSFRLLVRAEKGGLRELAAEPQHSLVLGADDALVTALARGATLSADASSAERSTLGRALRRRVDDLGVRLAVPLGAGAELAGAFLLGPRADGRLYTSDDQRLIETLAAQSLVAIENARAWEEVAQLQARLSAENVYLRREIQLQHDFKEIVGSSSALKALLAQVEQVAPTDATVLVCGETGTGKELVVRALHDLSPRRERALVKVACAAIPESLLESELFGHERGAFTGASARQIGRLELAHEATIFFDDVDTLPLGVQAKLLRAIQEGEIQRLGSTSLRRIDARIIAATNKDLAAEVAAGRFREDLYYRLNVVPIGVPPLRERREDIESLVQHFAARAAAKVGRSVSAISEEALAEMGAYDWPGNVRELQNIVERAIVLSTDDVLRLPAPLAARPAPGPSDSAPASLADDLLALKIRRIREALAASGGNQRRAAELLGLHRPSLTRMIRELGIREPGPTR